MAESIGALRAELELQTARWEAGLKKAQASGKRFARSTKRWARSEPEERQSSAAARRERGRGGRGRLPATLREIRSAENGVRL